MIVAQIFASSLVSFDVKRVYGLMGTSVLVSFRENISHYSVQR